MNFKYLLINLLRIEFIILRLFFNIYLNLILFNFEIFFLIVFLRFIVCEGVLGLSLLISIVRILGSSNIQNIYLLKI